MTNTRKLKPADSARIRCQRGRYGDPDCTEQATICETVDWNTGNTAGTSFFYLCDSCHHKVSDTQRRAA